MIARLLSWLGVPPALTSAAHSLVLGLAALVLLGLPPVLAYRLGYDARDRKAQAQAAHAQIQQLEHALSFNDLNARLAGDYVLRRAATQVQIRSLRMEVPRVVTHYVPAPGAPPQPAPDCVFTHGFVRMWNQALHAGTPAATAAARNAGPAAGAGAAAGAAAAADADADLLDAGIGPGDVLHNHLDNAEVCAGIRAQCETLRQWAAALDTAHEVTREH